MSGGGSSTCRGQDWRVEDSRFKSRLWTKDEGVKGEWQESKEGGVRQLQGSDRQ